MALTLPLTVNSVHRPIYFGVDYNYGYSMLINSVTNENGYAKFNLLQINQYGTPPCQYIYVTFGTYIGLHTVKEIDSNGNILTATKFNGSSAGTLRCLLNYKFEILYTNDSIGGSLFISPVWNSSAKLISNLSPFLVSVMDSPINPPYQGIDDSLWLKFKVKLRLDIQTKAWIDSNNLIEDNFILNIIGYNWNLYTYKSIRSTVENTELLSENIVNNGFLKPKGLSMPIFFNNKPTLYSKWDNGKVRNILIV